MHRPSAAAPQYHRRTFRGAAGATDRQLPKHNAARRRRRQSPSPKTVDPILVFSDAEIPAIAMDSDLLVNEDDDANQSTFDDMQTNHDDFSLQIIDQCTLVESVIVPPLPEGADNSATQRQQEELDHLRRRIRNNRTSMSLSATAMANPSSYQSNVLAACVNTAKEWRSILRHYPDLDADTKKSIGLLLFELIQQSLQCGPLAGAKPGYFKRCGSEMAAIVHQYLLDLVTPVGSTQDTMCFSQTQDEAIQRWKEASYKAMISDQAPSKSVLKAQERARKKK
jgi:hypothetical protein